MKRRISLILVFTIIMGLTTIYLSKDNIVNAKPKQIKTKSLQNNSNAIHRYDFKNDVGSTVIDSGSMKSNGKLKGTKLISENGQTFRRFNGYDDCIEFNNPLVPLGKKVVKFKMRVPERPDNENYAIMSNRSSGEKNQSGFCAVLYAREQQKRLYFTIWKGAEIQTSVQCEFPYDNNFHEIMFTFDDSVDSNNVKLYLDDMVNPKSVSTCSGGESSELFNFSIGKDTYKKGDYNFFKGDLADIEVYNSIGNNNELIKLTVFFNNGTNREYLVTAQEAERFGAWYEDRANGNGSMVFVLNKKINGNQNAKEYLNFNSISNFEIS